MSFAVSLAQLLLAAVFAVAGIAKLLDRAGTRRALGQFGVPARLAPSAAIALPLAELAVAAALVVPETARGAAVAGLALLLLFSGAIALTLARGSAPDCNCFGGLSQTAVGRGTLARNLALGALAAFAALAASDRPGGAFAWIGDVASRDRAAVIVIAVLVVALLALAWFCWQLLRQNGRLLLRLDAQAAELGAGGPVPEPPLEVGDPAPSFARAGLDDEPLSLDSLLAPGLPLALLFTDPDCGACQAPLEAAGHTQRERAGQVTVAVIARGHAGRLRERVDELALGRVIHDVDDSLFGAFRVAGSPGALLVGADGRVASAPAMGAGPVLELLAAPRAAPARVLELAVQR